MSSLYRSVYSVLSGRLIGVLISLIFTPILVRVLSQDQYGLFASVMAGLSIFTLISQGGLFDSIRRTVAKYKRDADELSSVLTTSLLLVLIYAFAAITILILCIWGGFIPSKYINYIWVLLGAILFNNIFILVRAYFHGVQKEHLSEGLNIARRVIYFISALGFAYIGYDVIGVFAGYTLSFVTIGLIGLAVLYQYSQFTLQFGERIMGYSREISTYGAIQLIGGLSATLLYKLDILLVAFFYGQTVTAIYQSAIIPAEMIWFIPSAIQIALLQDTASNWAKDDTAIINSNIKQGVKYSILSLTLFGTGLLVLAEPFLQIYFGPKYVGSATALKILILGTFFMGITRPVNAVLQATGWIRYTEFLSLGSLILNVILNLVLIPRFGIIGASIGTAASYFSIFIGQIWIWNCSPFELVPLQWIGRLALVQGLFIFSFISIASIVDLRPLTSLILFPPIGFILFISINIGAGYIPIQKFSHN